MPLSALKTCYEAEYDKFVINNDDGVPLEHLVTCVHGVSISLSPASGVKVLVVKDLDDPMNGEEVTIFGHF